MGNILKRAVQRGLAAKRNRLYRDRLERQTIPYDVWLSEMENQEKAELLAWRADREKTGKEVLSASVLSEEEFCGEVFGTAACGDRDDLWLVTSDPAALTETALWEAIRYFEEHPECGIAYGDESFYFKPGWSPDLLQSFFYFGNVFAVRRTLAEKAAARVSGRAVRYDKELPDEKLMMRRKLYDIVLCCIDEAKEAGHIEKLLFWSGKRGKAANGIPDTEDILPQYGDWGRETVYDEIKKGHLYSDIEIPEKGEDQKLVSVIIPSKDNPAVLFKCIHSLRDITDYERIEIIVIDNGSNDKNKNKILQINDNMREEFRCRYIYQPMPFNFSAMCNIGARAAKGEFLLFLNDDMEIAEENWLRVMLSRAEKSYVGAVGAKLLYPNSEKIQHLGVTSIHLGPAHELQFSLDDKDIYHGYNKCAVNVSAVTGACMLMRREVFDQTGGFSEDLQVAFNDVEICFKMQRAGYTCVCCNDTYLYHHESLSRGHDAGYEKLERLHRERDVLYAAYPEMWNNDRYYSKKLVTDILDRGYMPAYRFEEKRRSCRAEVVRMEKELKEEWRNESLCLGVEFAGDRCAWETGRSGGGDYYIQACSYAVTIDNSRYKKSLLLKPADEENGPVWQVLYEECHRPDMAEALPFIENPALCGVSLWIGEDVLPPGRYLIGSFWEDTCSRQKLYKFVPEILTVHERMEGPRGV